MISKHLPKPLHILLTFLFLTACSILPPAEDCGGGIPPDRDALEEYFTDLQLLGRTTDQSAYEGPEVGRIFQPTDELTIQAGSNREQTVRLCIFESKPAGEIVFDQTYSLSTGEEVVQLGSFEEGPYVIRVFTNGTLVHNFQFLIR